MVRPLKWQETGPGATRVLMAVLAGARTVPHLVEVTGRSRAVVHAHLCVLRDRGLVDWEDGKIGTLHPLVKRVA